MNKKEDEFYRDLLEDTRNIYKDWVDALQQKVNQLETNRDEAIEYLNENALKPISYEFRLYETEFYEKILEILERGKE